jgi:hypothetical protein
MTETHEFVVPKSIPMTSAAEGFELHKHRRSVSADKRARNKLTYTYTK